MAKTPQSNPDETKPETQPEAQDETGLEAVKAAASEPIRIVGDQSGPKFQMMVSDERPEGFEDPIPQTLEQAVVEAGRTPPTAVPSNYKDSEVLRKEKEREAAQSAAFRAKLVGTLRQNIKEARAPDIAPPQPVSAAISEQTRLELEAGRKMNEHHDGLRTRGPIAPRRDDPREGTSVPVFRPGDIDEYRKTFKSQAQTPDKTSGAVNL